MSSSNGFSRSIASTLVLLFGLGCGAAHAADAGVDGGVDDGGVDAGTGTDASAPDAGIDAGVDAGTDAVPVTFWQRGYCFTATACGVDADCGEPDASCSASGRCVRRDRPCGCISDADCPSGAGCFTNEVVCGICLPLGETCADPTECGGAPCIDGWCAHTDPCIAL